MDIISKIETIWEAKGEVEISDKIKEISNSILNDYQLKLNNELWDIIEIEFYFNTPDHKDPYVHKHSTESATVYKTGQLRIHGAGIDIAISNSKGSYGGILLRTIKRSFSNDTNIEGPINVCDAIIRNMGTVENSFIKIIGKEESSDSIVYQALRVGLLPKKYIYSEKDTLFLIKDYRFFTDLKLKNEKYIIALGTKNGNSLDRTTYETYRKSFIDGKNLNYENFDKKFFKEFNKLHNKVKLYGYFNKRLEL